MSNILEDAINSYTNDIEEELAGFIKDKLNNNSLGVEVCLSVRSGFTNGWGTQIVFRINVEVFNIVEELFNDYVEISDLDDFESEVFGMLGELMEGN